MVQDFTAFRKISFQTVDVEVALAEIEYQYLKFVCEATLRNSDEVLREQIRQLQIAGLPSFDEWRKQDLADVRGILSPSIEAKTIPTIAIASSDSAETVVEPQHEQTSDRPSSEPSARKVKQTQVKPEKRSESPSKAAEKLLQRLSEPAMAKLTSREVIEQEHERLTVLLKEGKSMDDLAALLTSNGAKISASTLRNYLSAARRKAKTGNATAKKKASPVATSSDTPLDSAEPTTATDAATAVASDTPIVEAATEPTPEAAIAPTKPKRGRPKAAAKSNSEHETNVVSLPTRKPSSNSKSAPPAPKRRKSRF